MNMKRMRGRNHRNNGGGGGGGNNGGGGNIRSHGGAIPLNRNHVFDSSGPDLRIRGTSQQLFEKYLQLGRDATGSGDRVMAESYFQHAEHYFRILNAMNQAAQQQNGGPNGNPYAGQNGGQNGGQGGYQPRRQTMQDMAPEGEYDDDQQPGLNDPPGGDSREIPIGATPPEG
jgi:hypothetical protein